MNPFVPQSIARHNARQTSGQRTERERERLLRIDPHLSDGQLHAWTDVAEKLLT